MRKMRMSRLALLIPALALLFSVLVGAAQRADALAQPPTDWSFYVVQTDAGKIEQLGCNQANYDRTVRANASVVLDFGAYNADGSMQINWVLGQVSQSEIEYLSEVFLNGYYSCNPAQYLLILSIGGNNSANMNYNVGVNSARTESAVLNYAQANLGDPYVGGAEDIETWATCNTCVGVPSSASYNWFNGYNAAGGNAYLDFGSADWCPTSGPWAYCSKTGWNAGDYYNFSQGWWQSHVAPEAYTNNDAAQWNWIRNVTNGSNGPVGPLGPLNTTSRQGGPLYNSPAQAWAALNSYFPYMYYSMEMHWEDYVCGKGPFHPNSC